MSASTNYYCESQQRILRALMCLFGHEIDGLTPGQVAKMAEITASKATRDLWNLEDAGLVERLPDGNKVRVSPRLGHKALAILHSLDSAKRQLDEITHRYTLNR